MEYSHVTLLEGVIMAARMDSSYRALPCVRCGSPVWVTWVNSVDSDGDNWAPQNPRCSNDHCPLSSGNPTFDEMEERDRSLANFIG